MLLGLRAAAAVWKWAGPAHAVPASILSTGLSIHTYHAGSDWVTANFTIAFVALAAFPMLIRIRF